MKGSNRIDIYFPWGATIPTYLYSYNRYQKGKKTFRKLVEKETIKDIWQHELVVMASLEGTYEAIEIQDKYCRAVKKVDYIE